MHNILLNKESERSIYQYCEAFYQNSRQCCISPSECNEDFGRETAQLLRQKSLSLAQDAGPSCQSSPKLSSFLWQAQSLMCQKGVSHCRQKCKDKLGELKRTFKQCFLIPASYSIDTILDRARTPSSHPHCWQEMRDVAKKYKEQSRNSQAVFKEYLKVRDIVDCESIIKQSVSRQNLNHFAFNICNQVQVQKQEPAKPEERKEPIRKQETKEPTKSMGHWPAYDAEEWEEQQEKIRQSHAAVFGYRIEKTQEPESSLSPEHNKEIQSEKWGVLKEEKYGIVKDEPSLETGLDMSPGSLVREVPDKPEEDNKSLSDTLSKSDKDISKNDKEENKDKSSQAGKTPKKPSDKALAKVPKKKSSVSKTKNSAASKSSLSQRPTKQKNPSVFVNKDRTQKTDSQVNKAKAKKNRSKRRKADSRTKQSKDLKKKQASKQDSSHASLAGSELKPSSNSKPLQVAQVSNSSGRCPVSMPEIKSAIVFQSVKAPQKDPIDQQELQTDPNNPSFTSYDLVYRKPAGVLIELDNFQNPQETFHLSLNIKGKPEVSECFHNPLNGQTMYEGGQTDCTFKISDLINSNYKFIPFPKKDFLPRAKRSATVIVRLYSKTYDKCETKADFKVNIIKVRLLDLGFTGISDKRCKNKTKGYKFFVSDKFKLVENFIKSKEVSEYIETMFPIHKLRAYFVEENNKRTMIIGNCNNTPSPYNRDVPVGVLEDIKKLEKKRKKHKFHKIVAIVPKDYFWFHYNKDWTGLTVNPVWKRLSPSKWKWVGGSWNIALVREDMKDERTLSHELGHTLGQGKEFYQKLSGKLDKNNNFIPLPSNKQSKCRKFNGSPKSPCHKYKIKLGLQAGLSNYKDIITNKRLFFWKFIQNKFSIMNNKPGIDKNWIDRDTYQKSFKVLSEREGGVAEMHELFLDAKSRQQIVFSGFYDTKKKQVIMSDTKLTKTELNTISIPKDSGIPIMSFQLKHKSRVLKQVNQPILELEMKLIHKDGTHKKIPNSLSPFLVGFDVNKSYANKTFQVGIVNPKTEELILSQTLSIKPKPKPKQKKQKQKRERRDNRETKETDFAFLFDSFN